MDDCLHGGGEHATLLKLVDVRAVDTLPFEIASDFGV